MKPVDAAHLLFEILLNDFSGRIFGIPILGYPTGTLDAFSTSAKCSGNGMRAKRETTKGKLIKVKMLSRIILKLLSALWQRQDRRRERSKTYITNSPGNGAFFTGCRCLIGLTFDAQVHNMITANSTVVDNNIYFWQNENENHNSN